MRSDLTELVVVLDRSGSMETIRTEVINGFNKFVQGQTEVLGEANLWLIQFDDEYEVTHMGVPIGDVPSLDEKTYVPRAMTALLDAMGRTINDVGARLANMEEDDRPSKVLVLVITDGHENASKEFTREKVLEMVSHQRNKYGWEFIFMAADEKAFADAPSYGVPKGNVMLFERNAGGTRQAYDVSSMGASRYRASKLGEKTDDLVE